MNTMKYLNATIGSLLLLFFSIQGAQAQTYKLNNWTSTLEIDGTSNLHDWIIKAEDQQGTLTAVFENGKLSQIKELHFSVTAESLKSGKSGMDKNTYKALNTDKHKQISFKMNKAKNVDCKDNCRVTVSGDLTIAGTTKSVDISLDIKVSGTQIVLSGSKNMKMTTFGVEPPKAMFGAITTGDAIDVKFQSTFRK